MFGLLLLLAGRSHVVILTCGVYFDFCYQIRCIVLKKVDYIVEDLLANLFWFHLFDQFETFFFQIHLLARLDIFI